MRRGYHKERDQMNGFLLTVLLAHLMATRVVHAHGKQWLVGWLVDAAGTDLVLLGSFDL